MADAGHEEGHVSLDIYGEVLHLGYKWSVVEIMPSSMRGVVQHYVRDLTLRSAHVHLQTLHSVLLYMIG